MKARVQGRLKVRRDVPPDEVETGASADRWVSVCVVVSTKVVIQHSEGRETILATKIRVQSWVWVRGRPRGIAFSALCTLDSAIR